jgi:Putative lumazine-binding
MKALLAIAAAQLAASPLAAEPAPDRKSDEAAVMATVEAFMRGLAAKDAAAMRAQVTEPGFVARVEEREGVDRVGLIPMAQLIASVSSIPVPVSEPLHGEVVTVDGPVATVRADYDFILDGKRSHCGVDIFTLMRIEGAWKIATITYSHLATGCEAAQ